MLNNKGQAAITDALLFLTIVGIISTMVIVSAMNYGLTITNAIQENYETTYIDSALKTTYIVNYGRDGRSLLDPNVAVGDYLMTKAKEEFASLNKTLKPETKKSYFKVLDQIFLTFPQKSYLIAIYYTEGTEKTLFVGIKTSAEGDPENNNDNEVIYLDCKPAAPLTALQNYLSAHTLDQRLTTGKAIFFENLIGNNVNKIDGSVILSMWTTTSDFDESNIPDLGDKAEFYWQDPSIDMNCYRIDIDN